MLAKFGRTELVISCSRLASSFKPNQGSGDSGQSSLFSLERRWKDDDSFEALGTIDELSSHLGLCRAHLDASGLFSASATLEKVQCVLQDVASNVATPNSGADAARSARTQLDPLGHESLEASTEALAASLPPLRSFILPSGGETASAIHVSRAVCRRAERRVVPGLRSGDVDPQAAKYLNRLSDYLFLLGRLAAQTDGHTETAYKKPKKHTRGNKQN